MLFQARLKLRKKLKSGTAIAVSAIAVPPTYLGLVSAGVSQEEIQRSGIAIWGHSITVNTRMLL